MENDEMDMLEILMRGLAGENSSNVILEQEARGQQQVVREQVLPRKINHGTREMFTEMGIVFHEKVDDLFVRVTLPNGWKKVPTGHSMWSNLVDEKGRTRATIFYKAAFYDRDAFMGISRRYSFSAHQDFSDGLRRFVILDCEKSIYKSDPYLFDEDIPGYERSHQMEQDAIAWLNEHIPNWKDPMAYWD